MRLYAYLDRAKAEGLDHPVLTLDIRLQFEFAARMSEILEWQWIDFGQSRVVWPDSKTGGISKPISADRLQRSVTRLRLDQGPERGVRWAIRAGRHARRRAYRPHARAALPRRGAWRLVMACPR